jgi:hypothetical protein
VKKAKNRFKTNYKNTWRAGWCKWAEEHVNDPRIIGIHATTPKPKTWADDWADTRPIERLERQLDREMRRPEQYELVYKYQPDKFEI